MAAKPRRLRNSMFAAAAMVMAAWAAPARAVLIDLEDRTGPSTFVAACGSSTACAQGITEHTTGGDVTLTGGVILTNTASLPADESTVYGSMSNDYIGSGANLARQITISFSQPVTGVMLDVINGLTTDSAYRIEDNLGNATTFTLASNAGFGATTIGFSPTGTVITITSLASDTTYDMLIDNIRFNEPMACDSAGCRLLRPLTLAAAVELPEPATSGLLAAAVAMLTVRRRRRRG